jgi:hypothetical protein
MLKDVIAEKADVKKSIAIVIPLELDVQVLVVVGDAKIINQLNS